METLVFQEVEENLEYFVLENGKVVYTIKREEKFNSKWVAREKNTGLRIDMDRYRSDLFERLAIYHLRKGYNRIHEVLQNNE